MWVTARFDVLLKSLYVTKTINMFLAPFRFLKKLQNFLMLLGIMHAASPLPKTSLISSYKQQKVWHKISVANFTKLFQSIFTVGGWRTYPFNLPLLALACKPTQSCKKASFWSLNPARVRHLLLKPDLGLKDKFTEAVKICATAQKQKTLCAGAVAGTHFITPKIATTLTKTLA